MRFICMFLPAFLAVKQEVKEKDFLDKKIYIYVKYCLLINFIMLIFLIIMGRGSIHFEDMCTVKYYLLYLGIGILMGYFFPKVFQYCRDNFKIQVKRSKR